MDDNTLEALRKSIKHWEENLAAKNPKAVSTSARDCALCLKFFISPNACLGCPVFITTSQTCCEGTPYSLAVSRLTIWKSKEPDNNTLRDKFRAAASDEVNFLKSLLPEEDQQP